LSSYTRDECYKCQFILKPCPLAVIFDNKKREKY
jgi:hypothetical protein